MSQRAMTAGELLAAMAKSDKWSNVTCDVKMLKQTGEGTYNLRLERLKIVGVRENLGALVLEVEDL